MALTGLLNKKWLGLIAVILLAVAGLAYNYFTDINTISNNKTVTIFEMKDPAEDDFGPGLYKYPLGTSFEQDKHVFDLREFKVQAFKENYIFEITFPEVIDSMGSPGGFMELIHIYIADGTGVGMLETERPGGNVIFDPGNPWRYLVKVMSWDNTAVFYSDKGTGQEGMANGVTAKVIPGQNKIKVTVPKKLLPGKVNKWKYYVLVGSMDGNGPDNFREVKKKASEWNFGGNEGSLVEPNVIDVLAPSSGVNGQKKMLSSYSIEKRKFAKLYPVGP